MKIASRKAAFASVAFALAATSGVGAARAADAGVNKGVDNSPYAPDWVVELSVQGFSAPLYPGARRYGAFGAPGIYIHKSDDPQRFSTPDDGFGIALYDTTWFRVGPVARYLGDRSPGHFRELTGLPDIDAALEVGGFVEANPLPYVRTRLEVLQAVTGHDGLVANWGADLWRRWGSLSLSVGPRLFFGNNQFAQAYFSVTPAQSFVNLASGGNLTPYNAVGGLTSAGLAASARYEINDSWRATLFGGYQRLTGSAAGSPIVEYGGSQNQFVGGLELAYRFHMAPLF